MCSQHLCRCVEPSLYKFLSISFKCKCIIFWFMTFNLLLFLFCLLHILHSYFSLRFLCLMYITVFNMYIQNVLEYWKVSIISLLSKYLSWILYLNFILESLNLGIYVKYESKFLRTLGLGILKFSYKNIGFDVSTKHWQWSLWTLSFVNTLPRYYAD